MSTAFVNVLYLLWEADQNVEAWQELLAEWAEISITDAERMIEDREINDVALRRVAQANHIEEEVLKYEMMISQEEMVRENVVYLLAKLKHGESKKLAEYVGVAQETVSKWKQGEQIPTSGNRGRIKEYLGVERNVDLAEDPLFLLQDPLTDKMRRADLHVQVREADRRVIRRYYEAIKKLLRG